MRAAFKPDWGAPLQSLAATLDKLLPPTDDGLHNFVHTLQIVTAETPDLQKPVSHIRSCQNDAYRKLVNDWVGYDKAGKETFQKSLVGIDCDKSPYRYWSLGSTEPIFHSLPGLSDFTYTQQGPWNYSGPKNAINDSEMDALILSWEKALKDGFDKRGAAMWVTQTHSTSSPEALLKVSSAFVIFNRAVPQVVEYKIAKTLRDFLVGTLFSMQNGELGKERAFNEQLVSRILKEAAEERMLGRTTIDYLEKNKKILLSTCPMLVVGESGTGKLGVAREIYAIREAYFTSKESERKREKGNIYEVNSRELPERKSDIRDLIRHKIGMAGLSVDAMQEERHKGLIVFNDIHQSSPLVQDVILELLDSSYKLPEAKNPDQGWFPLRKSLFISLPGIDVAANSGRFNPSLYVQMAPFVVTCPPLRELQGDLPATVPNIIAMLKQALAIRGEFELGETDWKYIREHTWPGNFRELYTYLIRKMLQE